MKSKSGFTIVELLIVIIIIGILASVSIFAYNGVQNRGTRNAAEANLRQNFDKLATWTADNGSAPSTAAQLETIGFRTNKKFYIGTLNTYVYCSNPTTQHYALIAQSAAGDRMMFSSVSGLTTVTNWGANPSERCVNNVGGSSTTTTNITGIGSGNVWQVWTGAF